MDAVEPDAFLRLLIRLKTDRVLVNAVQEPPDRPPRLVDHVMSDKLVFDLGNGDRDFRVRVGNRLIVRRPDPIAFGQC